MKLIDQAKLWNNFNWEQYIKVLEAKALELEKEIICLN